MSYGFFNSSGHGNPLGDTTISCLYLVTSQCVAYQTASSNPCTIGISLSCKLVLGFKTNFTTVERKLPCYLQVSILRLQESSSFRMGCLGSARAGAGG